MITYDNQTFCLATQHTSYLFRIEETGHLEHLHYGGSLTAESDNISALSIHHSSLPSATIAYSPAAPCLSMELLRGEISTQGKGDFGDPFIEVQFADGSVTCDFIYDSFEITDQKPDVTGLPQALTAPDESQTLTVHMREAGGRGLLLSLYYTVYESCDVIVRSAKLRNMGSEPVLLNRLLSSQIDFDDSDYILTSFSGSWTNEMNRTDTPCIGKTLLCESRLGFSSNRANPFVMLSRPDCTETSGEVYGSNLIYSGDHRECAQSGELGRLRFSTGIQPENFCWHLESGAAFQTPEAVLSYSDRGYETLSHHFHNFIRRYIIRGKWAHLPRPVLINSWEAAYFDINEEKLVDMARQAKDLGIELLVMDDGWFGRRNSTKSSMGDWFCDYEKLPEGINGLSRKIHDLGMQFGIWVEPEVISEDSRLFRAHPDWALRIPGQPSSQGRNTHMIDMTNPDVIDYLYDSLSEIFSQGIDYVKWDMNRGLSDRYSPSLPASRQSETGHRFLLGLYQLLERLTKRFPNILFESCASGGNRADLGMLCYMPQFWASDNSDALCRQRIQTGYSYGYPLTVLGCHVSSVPNHQTLRETPLSTRYEVAALGLLGYELDPARLTEDAKEDIRAQIAHYKSLRKWLMDASLYRIKTGASGNWALAAVSHDKKSGAIMTLQEILHPGSPVCTLRARGFEDEKQYRFSCRPCMMNITPSSGRSVSFSPAPGLSYARVSREKEDYTITGALLNQAGIRMKSDFIGHNLDEDTRYYVDYATRFYDLYESSSQDS